MDLIPPFQTQLSEAQSAVTTAKNKLDALETAVDNTTPAWCDQDACDEAKALVAAMQAGLAVAQRVKEKLCDDCSLS